MSTLSQFRYGGKQALYTEILRDSPRAYWICDETSGTSFADSSGNGYTMTLTGSFPAGVRARTMLLADESNYLYLGNNTDRLSRAGTLGLSMPLASDYTCECVVMAPYRAADTYRMLTFGASGETLATNYQLSFNLVATTLRPATFWEYGAGTNSDAGAGEPANLLAAGRPYHVVMTHDYANKLLDFYVNGFFHSRGSYQFRPAGGTSCSTYIGWSTSTSSPMVIGHVAYYHDYIMPEARVKAHFAATGLQWGY